MLERKSTNGYKHNLWERDVNKHNDEINRKIESLHEQISDLASQLDPIDELLDQDLRMFFRLDKIFRLGQGWSHFHKKQGDTFTLQDVWTNGEDEFNYQMKESGEEEFENEYQRFVDHIKEEFQIS